MDIRSFFVKKNAQAPPATPVVKAEDSKRKIEDSGAEAQKKVRSSPPEAAATSIRRCRRGGIIMASAERG